MQQDALAESLQVRIVYARTVYIARINRRVRPVGDGLVAAMAHLWSKFTKCLRPSKGASDPGPLPSPNVVPLSAQCHVIRHYYVVVITTSRKQRDPSSFYLSFALRLSPLFMPRSNPYFICLRSSERSQVLPLVMNITLITEHFLLRLYRSFNDAICCALFMGISR